jgi:hypothetical protein
MDVHYGADINVGNSMTYSIHGPPLIDVEVIFPWGCFLHQIGNAELQPDEEDGLESFESRRVSPLQRYIARYIGGDGGAEDGDVVLVWCAVA